MSDKRVLVVGWDGATFKVLEPLLAAGELPNLARLMRRGVRGRLRSVPNMNSGPAWTSVTTGLNPGKHGVFGLVGLAKDSYRVRPLNAADRHGTTLWQRLSLAGKRAVIMNVPLTYPAEPVNGLLVSGGGAPSVRSPDFTYPGTLIDELEEKVGEYILAARLDGLIRAGKKAEALARLQRMVDSRTQAALYLMEQQSWDLFFVVFTASDMVQHYYWGDQEGGEYRHAIRDTFRRLDDALGMLLSQAGPQVQVLVISDHGFGPTWPGPSYVNRFLSELGLLQFKVQRDWFSQALSWMFLQLERHLNLRTKEWLIERFPELQERAATSLWLDRIDWSATRAFSLAGSNQIWVNLRGRYPKGIVAPGREYEQVVARMQRLLCQAVDPVTGEPAVKAVRHRSELYQGGFVEEAPDLLVEWAERPLLSGLALPEHGEEVVVKQETARRRYLFSGSHREMGILVAAGSAFRKGTDLGDVTLLDIAPTLLHLLDQHIPTSLDGQLLRQALAPECLGCYPARYDDESGAPPAAPGSALSSAEEDEVIGRLRALGYVD